MTNLRIVVVGAGVMGASAAYRLAQRAGSQVTLIDQSEPGAGTTSTSMAWLNASNKTPREYFDLNFAGLREYSPLTEELGDADWFHQCGSLVSASYAEALPNLGGLEKRAQVLRDWGYTVEELSAAEATKWYAPRVRFRNADELVVRFADEGWIDGFALVRSLVRHFTDLGGHLRLGCSVVGIDNKSAEQFSVRLNDGTTIPADIVVNAGGPVADSIAEMVGSPIKLVGNAGLVVRLKAPDGLVQSMVLTGDGDVRPDGEGYYRIHSDGIDARLTGPDANRDELVSDMLASIQRVVPELSEAVVVREYSAVRPMPEDTFTSLGPVSSVPGYYEMISHSGITFGPLFGRIISQFVLDDVREPSLVDAFLPDRFRA